MNEWSSHSALIPAEKEMRDRHSFLVLSLLPTLFAQNYPYMDASICASRLDVRLFEVKVLPYI
ncbi:hypothetical protein NR402_16680, partial [Acidithiobacillus ferrooxidans]|uniref:hypothetical protein n=1 Tax=Acidithiobacillus ferrooxidans TaxID=920 RepID=UPI00214AF69E